jgi:hypothetical protein
MPGSGRAFSGAISMSEEKEFSLRDAAVAAVMAADGPRGKIVELLTKYQEAGLEDDIVYAIIFELEIVMRIQENINFQNRQMNELMLARLEKLCNANQEKMLDIINRQQMIGRSQFRRLIALHRERLLTRLIMICALGCISIFAGLGVFYFYILVVW